MLTELLLVFGVAAAVALLATLITALTLQQRSLEYRLGKLSPINSQQFLRDLTGVAQLHLFKGNCVELLKNGAESFPAMFEAVNQAESSITFENYIYWSGEIGRSFAELLAKKAEQGVAVHVLLDWFGAKKMDRSSLEIMRAAGVQVRRYHRPRLGGFHLLNYRTHRRELVVDGKIGFTGGVGFADEWAGDGRSKGSRRDNHYRIEGPVVTAMQTIFLDNWLKTSGQILHGEAFFPAQSPLGDRSAGLLLSSPEERTTRGRLLVLFLLESAQKSIRIEQAYFLPDSGIVEALANASKRGVDVQIILPGEKIDFGIVRRASRARWGPLLEAGAAILEYQPSMLHTKLIVVDDQWVVTGSANLDYRSLFRSDEVLLGIDDAAFAEQHVREFDRDKQHSRRISLQEWQRRSWRQKALDKACTFLRTQM